MIVEMKKDFYVLMFIIFLKNISKTLKNINNLFLASNLKKQHLKFHFLFFLYKFCVSHNTYRFICLILTHLLSIPLFTTKKKIYVCTQVSVKKTENFSECRSITSLIHIQPLTDNLDIDTVECNRHSVFFYYRTFSI
jgi:hypothetical protein